MQQCILSIRETLQEILGSDPGIPRQGRQPSTLEDVFVPYLPDHTVHSDSGDSPNGTGQGQREEIP